MLMNLNKKAGAGVMGIVSLIIGAVFAIEGGYVNNPSDPGGETKYGITVKVARDYGYKGPMIELSKEMATEIYTQEYVVKPGFLDLIEVSPAVAHKVIDAGVNCGVSRSIKWFQTGLNSYSRAGKDFSEVKVDGLMGKATLDAYRALESKRGPQLACELMIKAMDVQQGQYYLSLNKHRDFTVGWVDHRINNIPLEMCVNYETAYGKIFD